MPSDSDSEDAEEAQDEHKLSTVALLEDPAPAVESAPIVSTQVSTPLEEAECMNETEKMSMSDIVDTEIVLAADSFPASLGKVFCRWALVSCAYIKQGGSFNLC